MQPSNRARNSLSLTPGKIASSSTLALGSAITSSSRPSKLSMMLIILMVAFFASMTGDDPPSTPTPRSSVPITSAFDASDGDPARPPLPPPRPPPAPCFSLCRKMLSTAS